MPGAPILSGTAGSLISILDACLVNGFGDRTADSLTVTGGIAAMTINIGHPFEADTVVLVAGATPSSLNGEKKVLASSGPTFLFDATGVSDQTATGTITAKFSPLGFTKPFSGTNIGAYRSSHPSGVKPTLRIDDTATTFARAVGYETMSDINTGIGKFPTDAQVLGGRWWSKSNAANSTPKPWTLVGDQRTFYFHSHSGSNTTGDYGGYIHPFGDFSPEKMGDSYASLVGGTTTNKTPSTILSNDGLSYSGTRSPEGTPFNIPRSYTYFGTSVYGHTRAESLFVGAGYSGYANIGVLGFPSVVNNGLYLSPTLVMESDTSNIFRGKMRGVYMCPQALSGVMSARTKIEGRGILEGRKLIILPDSSPAGSTSGSNMFIDITGPWIE